MYMNLSIIQTSSRFHLKITKLFHTKEDNSKNPQKLPEQWPEVNFRNFLQCHRLQ